MPLRRLATAQVPLPSKESHPITEDYGLLKPAPHSALPDIISVIETSRDIYPPLRPLRSPARRDLAVLTSLTPPPGAGAVWSTQSQLNR